MQTTMRVPMKMAQIRPTRCRAPMKKLMEESSAATAAAAAAGPTSCWKTWDHEPRNRDIATTAKAKTTAAKTANETSKVLEPQLKRLMYGSLLGSWVLRFRDEHAIKFPSRT